MIRDRAQPQSSRSVCTRLGVRYLVVRGRGREKREEEVSEEEERNFEDMRRDSSYLLVSLSSCSSEARIQIQVVWGSYRKYCQWEQRRETRKERQYKGCAPLSAARA